jgi:hypothetical protein
MAPGFGRRAPESGEAHGGLGPCRGELAVRDGRHPSGVTLRVGARRPTPEWSHFAAHSAVNRLHPASIAPPASPNNAHQQRNHHPPYPAQLPYLPSTTTHDRRPAAMAGEPAFFELGVQDDEKGRRSTRPCSGGTSRPGPTRATRSAQPASRAGSTAGTRAHRRTCSSPSTTWTPRSSASGSSAAR